MASRTVFLEKATVAPLYVMRPLLNADDLIAWAKEQGFETTLPAEEMHVTIAYSKQAVDWSAAGDHFDHLRATGGKREVVPLGDEGAVVLKFELKELSDRWQQFIDAGASWDWPSYQPHITITYNGEGVDLAKVTPYDGPLDFGPEQYAPLDEDGQDGVVEKFNPHHEPAGSPIGGQFAHGDGDGDFQQPPAGAGTFVKEMWPKPEPDAEAFDYQNPPDKVDGIWDVQRRDLGEAIEADSDVATGLIRINSNEKFDEMFYNWKQEAEYQHSIGWFSNPHPNGLIWHEIGHIQAKLALGRGSGYDRLAKINVSDPDFLAVSKQVSGYARTNGQEFVAEVYSGLRAGEKFPDPVMKAYTAMVTGSYTKAFERYSPDQPRAPAGTATGGEWIDEGAEPELPGIPPAPPAPAPTPKRPMRSKELYPEMWPKKDDAPPEFDVYHPPEFFENIEIRQAELPNAIPMVTELHGDDRPPIILVNSNPDVLAAHALAVHNPEAEHWNSSNDINHPIIHEMGHVRTFEAIGYDRMGAMSGTRHDWEQAIKVSYYATTQPQEFVAEVYAGMRFGKVYPASVLRIYDRMLMQGAPKAKAVEKYSPDQPRDPAGTDTGGQWTDWEGHGPDVAAAATMASAGQPGGTDFKKIAQQAVDEVRREHPRYKDKTTAINGLNAAMRDASKYTEWRDWYERHQPLVTNLYGPTNEKIFEQYLAAGSINQGVQPNVTESVLAMNHYLTGGRFDDGSFITRIDYDEGALSALGTRLNQYQEIADGSLAHGNKVGPFQEALSGKEAVPIDRHMREIIFQNPGKSSTTDSQALIGDRVVRAMAHKMGWRGEQLQAVLWSAHLAGEGKDYSLTDYREELLKHEADIRAFVGSHIDVKKAVFEDWPLIGDVQASFKTQADGYLGAAQLITLIDLIHKKLGTTNPDPQDIADLFGWELPDDQAKSMQRYSPDQPREPAGIPEGGQFLDTGKTAEEIARQATRFQWAKDTIGDGEAENGNPAWKNFMGWFGDSTAVDDAGLPLTLYQIDINRMTQVAAGPDDEPLYARMERPLAIKSDDAWVSARETYAKGKSDFPFTIAPESIHAMWGDGYDSVMFHGRDIYGSTDLADDEFIVFWRDQMKSATHNNGSFDPRSNDIAKYSPDQPRVPAGNPTGGQWTDGSFNIAFEIAPNPDEVELTARWDALTDDQKVAISNRIMKQYTPEVLDELGMKGKIVPGFGGYEGHFNPNYYLDVRERPFEVAGALGQVLRQKSMVVIADVPGEGFDKVSFGAVIAPNANTQELHSIEKALGPIAADGWSYHNNKFTILDFGDETGTGRDLAARMDEQLGGRYEIGHGAIHSVLIEAQDYANPTNVRSGTPWGTVRDRIGKSVSATLEAELQAAGKAFWQRIRREAVIREALSRYSPDQPRDPAGTPTGGEWTDWAGHGGDGADTKPEESKPAGQEPFDYRNPPKEYEGIRIEHGNMHFRYLAMANPETRSIRITTNSLNTEKIDHMGDHATRMYEEGWFSSGDVNHIINHEIGHIRADEALGIHSLSDQAYLDLHNAMYEHPNFFDVAHKVSGHAGLGGSEFVAETYAGMRGGKRYGDDVMGLYRDLLHGKTLPGEPQ